MRSIAFAVVLVPALSLAQFKAPETKQDEQSKYHPKRGPGTDPALRLSSYKKRLDLEAQGFYGGLKWRNIGPEIQGGRVIQFANAPGNPNELYTAFATGGLWRSVDMGENWKPIFDTESAFAIGDIAVAKKSLWVATGENNSQRTSYAGTGVFLSEDRGATWSHRGLAELDRIGRILVDPKDEKTVYVAGMGALYSQGPNRGVFKTTDAGRSWKKVLYIDEFTGAIDIEMDPRNSQVLYASTWDRDRRAWNFREGGAGTAIYKSSNGGQSWTKLTNGLPPQGEQGRIGLVVAPSRPSTVYAFYDNQAADPDTFIRDEFLPGGQLTARRFLRLTEETFVELDDQILTRFVDRFLPTGTKAADLKQAVKDGKTKLADISKLMEQRNANVWQMELGANQVYRSDDAGKTWKKTHFGSLGEFSGYYWGKISVSPHDHNDLVIMGVPILRSRDGGKTWTSFGQTMHVDHHVYWYSPFEKNFQVCGNDGGLYFSRDDGANWRHVNQFPVAQPTTIAVDDKTPYNVYIGNQDNGTMKGPSNYRPGFSDLFRWTDIGGGDGSAIAIDPRGGGDLVYGASQFGAHYAVDQLTGQRYSLRTTLNQRDLRWNWVSPIQISKHHPDIVYLGSNKVHRSFDRGRTFTTLSPDLTKNKPNGDVPFSTLKDLSESPFKFGLIYVGADDGSVKMTPDGGDQWVDIATPEPDKWVSRVVASRHDVNVVYVSQSGYRDDDIRAYLWRSEDQGKTWKSIVGNLPEETINVVREDPTKKDWLYVGTDLGVFFTSNLGKTWTPLNGGIPRTPVHDLAIQEREKDLVAASHARGAFIFDLDDLYRLEGSAPAGDLHLWEPASMSRGNWEYRRRPEYDMSDGVEPTLPLEIWTTTAGDATIRLVSKDGKEVAAKTFKLVRGYNRIAFGLRLASGKPLEEPGKDKPNTAQEAIADPYANFRAKYVPAGEYEVEVKTSTMTAKTPWKLTASN